MLLQGLLVFTERFHSFTLSFHSLGCDILFTRENVPYILTTHVIIYIKYTLKNCI